jgi:hypothetical protein
MFGAAISSSIVYLLWFFLLLFWYFTTHRDQKISQIIVRKEDISQILDMIRTLKLKAMGRTV